MPRLRPEYWNSHRAYLAWFTEYGCLYGPDYDQREATMIRLECEERGLPMGYGRVGRTPVQLSADECPKLFPKRLGFRRFGLI